LRLIKLSAAEILVSKKIFARCRVRINNLDPKLSSSTGPFRTRSLNSRF
jgi:hypothetical protein